MFLHYQFLPPPSTLSERLPDRFVSEALGLDLREHYKQIKIARARVMEEAEEAAVQAGGLSFLQPIPAARKKAKREAEGNLEVYLCLAKDRH